MTVTLSLFILACAEGTVLIWGPYFSWQRREEAKQKESRLLQVLLTHGAHGFHSHSTGSEQITWLSLCWWSREIELFYRERGTNNWEQCWSKPFITFIPDVEYICIYVCVKLLKFHYFRNKAICNNTDGTEIIILNEISQKEKDKYHISLI